MKKPIEKTVPENQPCYVVVGLLWHIVIPNPNFRRDVVSDSRDYLKPAKGRK